MPEIKLGSARESPFPHGVRDRVGENLGGGRSSPSIGNRGKHEETPSGSVRGRPRITGISSALGATAANASIRPHAPFAVTVSKTTRLSTTANTKLKVKITGASKGDALEAGICNDDASQTSPLSDPTDVCTSPDIAIVSASGSVSITLTLKPRLARH